MKKANDGFTSLNIYKNIKTFYYNVHLINKNEYIYLYN